MLLDLIRKNKTEKQNVEMIPVPDLRDYILKGYDEIRTLKQEKEGIEKARDNYKEEAEDNRKLYNTALLTSNEFKKRDIENQEKIKNLKHTIDCEREFNKNERENKNNEINILKEKILVLEEKQEEINEKTKQEIIKRLIENVKNQRGNLSKEKVLKIIKDC